jgi:hypothetical protein
LKGGVEGGLFEQASGFLADPALWQHHLPASLLADLDVLVLVVFLEVDAEIRVSCDSGEGMVDTEGEELRIGTACTVGR